MTASIVKVESRLLNMKSSCEMYFRNVQLNLIPGKLYQSFGKSVKMIFNPGKWNVHPGIVNEKCYTFG